MNHPNLVSPAEGAPVDAQAATFRWTPGEEPAVHEFMIAKDATFEDVVFEADLTASNEITIFDSFAPDDQPFFWRVRARNNGNTYTSETGSFWFGTDADLEELLPDEPEVVETQQTWEEWDVLPYEEPTSLLAAVTVVAVMVVFGFGTIILMMYLPYL